MLIEVKMFKSEQSLDKEFWGNKIGTKPPLSLDFCIKVVCHLINFEGAVNWSAIFKLINLPIIKADGRKQNFREFSIPLSMFN